MQMIAYLHFKDDCRAAFAFYEKVLRGKIEMMLSHADSPMKDQMPPGMRDKIMHARLKVGDAMLFGSDSPPEYNERPQGFAVSLMVDSAAEAERIYAALAEGGTVRMPIQETFWAVRFAMLVDKFGVPWMVNYSPEPS